jgi:uncharacterized protein
MSTRWRILTALVIAALACRREVMPTAPTTQGPPAAAPIRVLMVTATAAFRHDAIPTARQAMARLAGGGEISVTNTEDVSTLVRSTLDGYDVLFFALTSGELPLSVAQKNAIVGFVSGGKGFLGVHSATDTLYEWPDYGALVGAYFREHPWTQEASVIVEDRSHPSTTGLGDRFALVEEFYTFRDNPRARVQVLLRLDAASVGATGDYPLAWAHSYGNGRVYYNALGHFPGTWDDSRFQQQIVGAMRWLARR